MESEFLRITIRLGKMLFPITVKRREEEIYRAAEKLINERLNFYAGKYQHQGDYNIPQLDLRRGVRPSNLDPLCKRELIRYGCAG